MADFFTSDTHFGHERVQMFCPDTRPQGVTPEEMDEIMIERWNSVVKPRDTVWHNGDFSFWYNCHKVNEVISRLNGEIHLTLGNHDEIVIAHRHRFVRTRSRWFGTFSSIENYREIKIHGQKIILFHFPIAIWHKNNHAAWHLYGHCHGSFPGAGRGKTMDVGWDSKDIPGRPPAPFSFEEIKAVMDERPIVSLDHHQFSEEM